MPGQAAEVTSGGRALPFYSSVRLKVQAGEKLKDKDEIYGRYIAI